MRKLLLIPFMFLTIKTYGQIKIKLKPDTSDSFILSFKTYNCNLMVGYNSFFNTHNIDNYVKYAIKKYIDSVKVNHDTVCISVYERLYTEKGQWFFLAKESEKIIKELIDNGNIVVFNFNQGKFITKLDSKKEEDKDSKKIVYKDEKSKETVFIYTISRAHYNPDF